MTTPVLPRRYTLPLVEVRVAELDLSCLPEVGAMFDRVLALCPAQVVVDLSDCRHLDAAAIGLLLDVHRRMSRADAVLTVRNPNPRVGRILHIAHLDQVLSIVTDPGVAARTAPGRTRT